MRKTNSLPAKLPQFIPICIADKRRRGPLTGDLMLALIISLVAGRSYRWQPELDLSDSLVLSTLFADGGH